MTDHICQPAERCCNCAEPTGRAGRGEDSIYIDAPKGALGPLCEECYEGIIATATAELTAERDALCAKLAAAEKSFRETIEQEVERAGKLEDELNAVDLCKQAIAHQHHEIERLTRKLAAAGMELERAKVGLEWCLEHCYQTISCAEEVPDVFREEGGDSVVVSLNTSFASATPDAGRLACEERERMREALELISLPGCERVFHGSCADHPEWTKDAKYTADKWCDSCIAVAALKGTP